MVNRALLLAVFLLCQIAHLVASLWMLFAIAKGSDRAWRLAVSYDQLANVAFGGHEDETISSRAQRNHVKGGKWGCTLCKLLNKISKDHCEKSLQKEIDDIEKRRDTNSRSSNAR